MNLLTTLAHHVVRRPQRIALLQQVAVQGSITQAAKAAGLSYKAAWDAIDEMNNLAGEPLVERSVGGKGGGGATLSATGERLLQLYQRLEALQAQLLSAAEQDGDMQLLSRLMLRTSARNQLAGQVCAIQASGRNDLIGIDLGGAQIQARITHESTEQLELIIGSPVIALFKAGTLQLHTLDAPADPALNQLHGHITQILDAADGPAEVRISLDGGGTLCALLDADALGQLALAEGRAVLARFSPDQILLGIPT